MDNSKHLQTFTIVNYRRFTDFTVENIGQFNLIVGDNNTGKTSLLEALAISNEDNLPSIVSVIGALIRVRKGNGNRQNFNSTVNDNFNILKNNTNPLNFQLELKDSVRDVLFDLFSHEDHFHLISDENKKRLQYDSIYTSPLFTHTINTNTLVGKITDENIKYVKGFYPFIPFGLGYEKDLENFYSDIQKNREEREVFIKSIKLFINKIEDVRIDANQGIVIEESSSNLAQPLYSYGEGANKLFRILLEIAQCKGKLLMIDEIDTGIHFSRFKEYWKTILQVARNYNVQIFATTHNEECIYYYQKALEELDEESFSKEARLITLKEVQDDVKAYTYGIEDIQQAADTGTEMRGGL